MRPCIYGDCSTPWPSTRHYTPAEYDAIVDAHRTVERDRAFKPISPDSLTILKGIRY